MTDIVAGLIVVNAVACLVAVYYAICAINTMSRRTPLPVWLAFIGQGLGWFVQFLAAIDYLHGAALAWPWFLLAGLVLANAGTGALYLANRRECRCPGCPARTKTRAEKVWVERLD